MVWSFKTNERTHLESCAGKLGHCTHRILFDGAGQPHRLPEWCKCISTEDGAGDHYTGRVHSICSGLFKRTFSLEIHSEFSLSAWRRLFHV